MASESDKEEAYLQFTAINPAELPKSAAAKSLWLHNTTSPSVYAKSSDDGSFQG